MAHSNGYNEELGMLKEDLSELRGDLSALAKSLSRDARKQMRFARRDLSKRAQDGIDILRDSIGGVTGSGKQALEKVQKQVETNPIATLCAALGVGFLLGKLLGPGSK